MPYKSYAIRIGRTTPLLVLLLFLTTLPSTFASPANFDQCLQEVREGKHGQVGGTDNHGNPVNVSDATALTYDLCVSACGGSSEAFDWTVFSQQIASWLLPWLALLSQLPFGANDKFENFESVIMTVGSPMLAAYSLMLSVLNERWIRNRVAVDSWPSVRDVMQVVIRLQHAPLRIRYDRGLLASLIVLEENDLWWKNLSKNLNYAYTWSIAAFASIAWVVIAYLFTVVDSFQVKEDNSLADQANGQGIGDLWIWLLPLVAGWLQLSPKCDSNKILEAFNKAKATAHVALADGTTALVADVADVWGLYLDWPSNDSLRQDEQSPSPIYYYSRFFVLSRIAEEIFSRIEIVAERAHNHLSVSGKPWNEGDVRTGNEIQVVKYCEPMIAIHKNLRSSGMVTRVCVSIGVALLLQWGTTGAAIVVLWFTPTVGPFLAPFHSMNLFAYITLLGLGCRSATYILYGVLSTLSWLFMFASSLLTNYIVTNEDEQLLQGHIPKPRSALRFLSTTSRRIGKTFATVNAITVILNCFLQFGHFFDRCFCKASVFGLRDHAFAVLKFTDADISLIRTTWILGVMLAGGTSIAFTILINLLIESRENRR